MPYEYSNIVGNTSGGVNETVLGELYAGDFGRIGVGTPDPLTKLHVFEGDSGASNFGGGLVVERDSTTGIQILVPDSTQARITFGDPSSAIQAGIVKDADGGLSFRASGNSQRAKFLGDMFAIGSNADPSYRFHLLQSKVTTTLPSILDTGPTLAIENTDPPNDGGGFALLFLRSASKKWSIISDINGDATDDLTIWDNVGASSSMTFTTGGNVGVGLTDPDVTLDVSGAIGITDGITAPATVTGKAFIYVDTVDDSIKVKFGNGTVKTLATNP